MNTTPLDPGNTTQGEQGRMKHTNDPQSSFTEPTSPLEAHLQQTLCAQLAERSLTGVRRSVQRSTFEYAWGAVNQHGNAAVERFSQAHARWC